MKSYKIAGFLAFIGTLVAVAHGRESVQSDTSLMRALYDTRNELSWLTQVCSRPGNAGNMNIAHDAILPGVYLAPVSCKGLPDAPRKRIAQLMDYFQEGANQDFQSFVSKVGYLTASQRSLEAVDAAGEGHLTETFQKLMSEQGLSDFAGKDSQNAEDCAETNFDSGSSAMGLSFAPTGSVNQVRGLQKSAQLVLKMSQILGSGENCESKKQQIDAMFRAPQSTDELDDYVAMSWLSRHRNEAARGHELRNLLGGAAQLSRPISGPAYDWSEGNLFIQASDYGFMDSAVDAKLLILGLAKKHLKASGMNGYDDLVRADESIRMKVAEGIVKDLDEALVNRSARDEVIASTRKQCDATIASVLGAPGSDAAATGMDYDDATTSFAAKNLPRFHVFKTMHMYPGTSATSHAPLYAPKGFIAAGAGGTAGIGSYIMAYPKLGRYQHVTLNFNHLADFQHLLALHSCPTQSSCGSVETNPEGNVRVGSTGGEGGEADGDGIYEHSHINLIAADGHTKLNFVDAFCK